MALDALANILKERGLTLSTIESCTGGLIAARCTDIAGSSAWFLGSLVTYSNDMKLKLGVDKSTLLEHGAVSEAAVAQMAVEGRLFAASDWSIAVTGIAGPDGGSPEKPVGLVWFGWASESGVFTESRIFTGNRREIREQTVEYGLQHLTDLLN